MRRAMICGIATLLLLAVPPVAARAIPPDPPSRGELSALRIPFVANEGPTRESCTTRRPSRGPSS